MFLLIKYFWNKFSKLFIENFICICFINKAKFIFIGANYNQELYNKLIKLEISTPSVSILSEIDFDNLMNYYSMADCIVVPSRLDPMPLVATYGFMQKKICILSDSIGTSKLAANMENAVIFENENSEQLADILRDIIENFDKYLPIAQNGRKLYEQYFSIDAFENKIRNQLNMILSEE